MCIVTEMDSRKAACSCTGSVLNVFGECFMVFCLFK